ncbi:MAG: hypothetical protein L0H70_03415 [Xanthomonadales bacterium]|nr:hypothetical protein [Xanthomonadales bacterium]
MVLLMEVIHDWPYEQAVAILTEVREAAPPGARVLLIEEMLSGAPGHEWVQTLDVLMLGQLGGRQRTHAEYKILSAVRRRRYALRAHHSRRRRHHHSRSCRGTCGRIITL